MTDEHQEHIENGTWDVTTLPPGKKVISCQWIYIKISTTQMAHSHVTNRDWSRVVIGKRQA